MQKSDLKTDPIEQFKLWFDNAEKSSITLFNAFSLATTNAQNLDIRTVLLKDFDQAGFVFFSNYNSHKARQIEQYNSAAMLFSWLELERQIKICGTIEKTSEATSKAYFASRPKNSKLSAWASKQSAKIASRQVLLNKFDELKTKFPADVPKPDFWGGYRLKPQTIEFWQGRQNRLHDRFLYEKTQEKWQITRLSP